MTKYIWPAEGQTFTQLMYDHVTNFQAKHKAPSKKRGRPVGSKNKEGHKAGRKDLYRFSPFYKPTPSHNAQDQNIGGV